MKSPVLVSGRLAGWVAILLGVAIPTSTALDNLLLVFLLPLMVVGAGREILHVAVRNPVARAGILLFAGLVAGALYGQAPREEALGILGKYVDLVFVPLLMLAARDAIIRSRAMSGFLIAILATAALSWLVALHVLPLFDWMWGAGSPDNPSVFRSSITQNVLMAYAVFLLALAAREAVATGAKLLLAISAAFASGDVLFLVQGKTGYFVLPALLFYFSWMTWARHLRSRGRSIGWREGGATGLLGVLLIFAAFQASPQLQERVGQMVEGIQNWKPGNPAEQSSVSRIEHSTGERMEFYANTLELIKQHPVVGVGTGGFPAAYAHQVQGKNVEPTRNPHNEYLLITAQIGVGGLLLLLYLFYTQWRCAAQLPSAFEQDAARGLVLTITITALFNSPLHDHTEGLFFAFASALLFTALTPKRHGG